MVYDSCIRSNTRCFSSLSFHRKHAKLLAMAQVLRRVRTVVKAEELRRENAELKAVSSVRGEILQYDKGCDACSTDFTTEGWRRTCCPIRIVR